MKRGVVYTVINNRDYVFYVAVSILSLRDSGYEGHISIFTDLPLSYFDVLKSENVDVLQVDPPKGFLKPSRWIKTRLALLSPYEETLALDADTVVLSSIDKIWENLSKGPVALCRDSCPTLAHVPHGTLKEFLYTVNSYPPSAMQYNTGVMLWRRSTAALKLFREWNKEWQKFRHIDQLAFIRAVQNTGIMPIVLPSGFNWNDCRLAYENQSPIIYHTMARKRECGGRFSGLYRRTARLTGVCVPSGVPWFRKIHGPRYWLGLFVRWLVRKRMQKLAERNFANKYKNL